MAFRTLSGIQAFQLVASESSSLQCTQMREMLKCITLNVLAFLLQTLPLGVWLGNIVMSHFIFTVLVNRADNTIY